MDDDTLPRRGSDRKEARIVKGRSLEVGYRVSSPAIKLKRSRTGTDEMKSTRSACEKVAGVGSCVVKAGSRRGRHRPVAATGRLVFMYVPYPRCCLVTFLSGLGPGRLRSIRTTPLR